MSYPLKNVNLAANTLVSAVLFGAALGFAGCSAETDEPGARALAGDGGSLPLWLALENESFTEEVPAGTMYIRVNDSRGDLDRGPRHVDRDGVAWERAIRVSAEVDVGVRFSWRDEFLFYVRDEAQLVHKVNHEARHCEEACHLTIWYTTQVLDGNEGDDVFWEAAPERWLQGEFEYVASDVVAGSSIANYDDNTGEAILNVAMVTLYPSDEGLSVRLAAHPLAVVDNLHPAISGTPPRNDAAERESPSLMDAGTTAE